MILKYPEDKEAIEGIIKKSEVDEKLVERTRKIILSVKEGGDKALIKWTEKFDKRGIISPKVDEERLLKEYKNIKKGHLESIERAIKNIRDFHKKQLKKGFLKTKNGKTIGEIIKPIKRVGLYIPGGRFPLISTLLMTAIPAKIAGCSEIAIASPPEIEPYILGICHLLGIKEVYQMGGAQAIAAFAYGTETVKRVSFIAGPGNIYVTIAKRLVFGDVGIDLLAGPSEILIIADSKSNPSFISTDLLAQKEHGEGGLSVLVTTSLSIAKDVKVKVKNLATIILTKSLDDACFVSNLFAPEHLCLYVKDPWSILEKIENAGCIFLGEYSPPALGDYIAGPSHVLPTSGSCKFFSGLSTSNFQKRISLISYTKEGVLMDRDAIALAELENLKSHKESIEMRICS